MVCTNRIVYLALVLATVVGTSLLSVVFAEETAAQNIAKTGEKMANVVTDTAKGISDSIAGVIDGAKAQASDARDAVTNAPNKVEEMTDDARSAASSTEKKAGSRVSDAIAAAEEAAASVTRKMEEIVSKSSSKANDATTATFGKQKEKSKFSTTVKNLKDSIASQSSIFADKFKGISVSKEKTKKIAVTAVSVWGIATGIGWAMQRFGDEDVVRRFK